MKKVFSSKSQAPMVEVVTSKSFDLDIVEEKSVQPKHEHAGRHFIVDFWGGRFFKDITRIEQALKDAAKEACAHLLHIHLHKFSNDGGVTGVALLAESHISVHTWPEHEYAAFDVFMCGSSKPENAVSLLKDVFKPSRVEVKEILRGELSQD